MKEEVMQDQRSCMLNELLKKECEKFKEQRAMHEVMYKHDRSKHGLQVKSVERYNDVFIAN